MSWHELGHAAKSSRAQAFALSATIDWASMDLAHTAVESAKIPSSFLVILRAMTLFWLILATGSEHSRRSTADQASTQRDYASLARASCSTGTSHCNSHVCSRTVAGHMRRSFDARFKAWWKQKGEKLLVPVLSAFLCFVFVVVRPWSQLGGQ